MLAGERDLTASKRRFWLPEFGLQATGGENLNRSGAGSNVSPLGIDDTRPRAEAPRRTARRASSSDSMQQTLSRVGKG